VLASGGIQDNATFWLAVGLIPLLFGLTLLLFIARRRSTPSGRAPGPGDDQQVVARA
jgi:hypothetical protein